VFGANNYYIFRSLDRKARVEIIKKTGHCPQIEDPAQFNKILKDFLMSADKPDPVCIKDSSL
jgi:pimeloyl-ACP methyl ester carboxylesterase